MLGQMAGWVWAKSGGAYVYSKTVQVDPKRDALMEIALSHVHEYGHASISQVVSNSGVENPKAPIAFRKGVSSVTFSLLVSDSGASARYFVNLWS